MFFQAEDLVNRQFPTPMKFTNVELVGDVKSFGHILIDNWFKISIWIHDEESIMIELEKTMIIWAQGT